MPKSGKNHRQDENRHSVDTFVIQYPDESIRYPSEVGFLIRQSDLSRKVQNIVIYVCVCMCIV